MKQNQLLMLIGLAVIFVPGGPSLFTADFWEKWHDGYDEWRRN